MFPALAPSRPARRTPVAARLAAAGLAIATVAAPASVAGAPAPAPSPASTTSAEGLEDVLFVGNNWEGSVDVVEDDGGLQKIGRLNAVPDYDKRLAAIALNPVHWPVFLYIRHTAGEGHDQLVDDVYSANDGKSVVISRPSFADVVSIDVETNEINWRFPMTGFRSDHMALSPDGKRVAVSDSSANRVHVLDVATGEEVGTVRTGDRPHENVFSPDGKHLWTMSIGKVENDHDDPDQQRDDVLKGKRYVTVTDAETFEPVRTIDMRDRLDAAGQEGLSDAVRPVAFTPEFDKAYFQVSYFNGFLEYDVQADRITRVRELPKNPDTPADRGEWVNDSRHHGITMKPDGSRLCVAGTMDDYTTVVDRETLEQGPLVTTDKPYWATVSNDGERCIVSESGADALTAIDFETGEKSASIPVGDHPQRVRQGVVPEGWAGPQG
ncbi:YncE family protein [Kytococcus sp. Marseille-QA3725]